MFRSIGTLLLSNHLVTCDRTLSVGLSTRPPARTKCMGCKPLIFSDRHSSGEREFLPRSAVCSSGIWSSHPFAASASVTTFHSKPEIPVRLSSAS